MYAIDVYACEQYVKTICISVDTEEEAETEAMREITIDLDIKEI